MPVQKCYLMPITLAHSYCVLDMKDIRVCMHFKLIGNAFSVQDTIHKHTRSSFNRVRSVFNCFNAACDYTSNDFSMVKCDMVADCFVILSLSFCVVIDCLCCVLIVMLFWHFTSLSWSFAHIVVLLYSAKSCPLLSVAWTNSPWSISFIRNAQLCDYLHLICLLRIWIDMDCNVPNMWYKYN